MDPKSPLIWFQLSKARHLTGDLGGAWRTLEICENLAPGNQEISAYMAILMVAEETPEPVKLTKSWKNLKTLSKEKQAQPEYVEMMIRLALKGQDESRFLWAIEELDILSTFHHPEMIKWLPSILRELNLKSWHQGARNLLQRITPEAPSQSS